MLLTLGEGFSTPLPVPALQFLPAAAARSPLCWASSTAREAMV